MKNYNNRSKTFDNLEWYHIVLFLIVFIIIIIVSSYTGENSLYKNAKKKFRKAIQPLNPLKRLKNKN